MSHDWRTLGERLAGKPTTVVVGTDRIDAEGGFELAKVARSDDAAAAFNEMTTRTCERLEAGTEKPYEVDAELSDGEYFLFEGDQLPEELRAFSRISSDAATADPVAADQLDFRSKFYAVVVGGTKDRVTFLRKTNPVMTTSTRRTIFQVGRGLLEQVEGPVFAFYDDFHIVLGSDWVAVLDQRPFEQLFRNLGLVDQHIQAWTKSITDHLPMASGSADALLEAARRDSRLWRKLKTIHQRGHLSTVQPKALRAYAESMDVDPDAVLNSADELIFDSATRFSVIHLLNEDLFRGELTKEIFEAQRKAATVTG